MTNDAPTRMAIAGLGLIGLRHAEVIGEIWAFLIVLLAALMVMILFPEMVLWLPNTLGQ